MPTRVWPHPFFIHHWILDRRGYLYASNLRPMPCLTIQLTKCIRVQTVYIQALVHNQSVKPLLVTPTVRQPQIINIMTNCVMHFPAKSKAHALRLYTEWVKKRGHRLMTIFLSGLNWFKNFEFFLIGDYLAKLQARTWLFCALSPSFSNVLAKHTKCMRQSHSCL